MSLMKCTAKSEKMRRFLTEVVPEASRATEFVQRQSKLTGTVLVEMWQWVCLEKPNATLNEMVQYCAALGVDITESGLYQRLNDRAVGLLSSLVSRVLQQFVPDEMTSPVLNQFRAINILDSSQLTLPAALAPWFKGNGRPGQRATAKIQVSVEYRSGQVKGLEVVDGRVPDQRCPGLTDGAEPGSLNLFDLGFFDQDRLADLQRQQAFFVTRLHSQVALYPTAEARQAVDLLAWLQAQPTPPGEGVFYLGRTARLPVRVIFALVPEAILDKRRRQAKAKAKQRGQTCTEHHLALLAWTLLITNAPQAWLSPAQVLALYPLRWQIELVFKLWKSQFQLASGRGRSLPYILCHLYAHLFTILWFHWLTADWRFPATGELSLTKAFHVVQRQARSLVLSLASFPARLPALLGQLQEEVQRFALKQKRRTSPSTYACLLALEP